MDKYYKSASKERKVQCRVCRKEIVGQNYRDHLLVKHPEEDAKNLREHGQAHLSWGPSCKKQQAETQEGDETSRARSRSPLARQVSTVLAAELGENQFHRLDDEAGVRPDFVRRTATDCLEEFKCALTKGELLPEEKLRATLEVCWGAVESWCRNVVENEETSRGQMLTLGVTVEKIMSIFLDKDREDDEEIAGGILGNVLTKLGEDIFEWTDLRSNEASMMKRLISKHPRVPRFVKKSLICLLQEKEKIVDENSNKVESDLATINKRLDEVTDKVTRGVYFWSSVNLFP